SHDRANVLGHIGARESVGGLRRVNDRRAKRQEVLEPITRVLELGSGLAVSLKRFEFRNAPPKLSDFRQEPVMPFVNVVIHEIAPPKMRELSLSGVHGISMKNFG